MRLRAVNMFDRIRDWWHGVTYRYPTSDWCPPSCRLTAHRCVCGRHVFRYNKVIVIDPDTLKRRYIRICGRDACRQLARSQGLRLERTLADWIHEHPEPVDLTPGIRIQYDGRSRRTLRAFVDSGLEAATVGGDPATLNLSATALGLSPEVYAEQRSGTTALRRARKRRVRGGLSE